MAQPSVFTIRRASPSDAVAVADLARETFVETFGYLYRPEDLAAFLKTSQSTTAYAPLLNDPRVAIWVAGDAAGALVGFLTAGPCKLPAPQREAMAGEIRQLYLRASVQRDGLGTRLLVTGLGWRGRGTRRPTSGCGQGISAPSACMPATASRRSVSTIFRWAVTSTGSLFSVNGRRRRHRQPEDRSHE